MTRYIQFTHFFFFIILLSVGISALLQCHSKPPSSKISINFYHWKNQLNSSSAEDVFLKSLDSKKLYLRYFDVDWDFNQKKAIPLSVLTKKNIPVTITEIVPTIFITNRTFLHLPLEKTDQLVENILQKINSINNSFTDLTIAEIQLDCDWTPKTKTAYFSLLKEVHAQIQKNSWQLSVTIRLHQLKFPKRTGVPPADRGVLMCYNVDDVQKWDTDNSILDSKVTSTYLSNHPDYPLPLNVALPAFKWGVLFRNGEMIKLINGLQEQEINDSDTYQQIANNRYKILQPTYLHGHYLYADDQLRLEKITISQMEAVASQLATTLPTTKNRELIFYHLDTMILNQYKMEDFNKIARIFDQ